MSLFYRYNSQVIRGIKHCHFFSHYHKNFPRLFFHDVCCQTLSVHSRQYQSSTNDSQIIDTDLLQTIDSTNTCEIDSSLKSRKKKDKKIKPSSTLDDFHSLKYKNKKKSLNTINNTLNKYKPIQLLIENVKNNPSHDIPTAIQNLITLTDPFLKCQIRIEFQKQQDYFLLGDLLKSQIVVLMENCCDLHKRDQPTHSLSHLSLNTLLETITIISRSILSQKYIQSQAKNQFTTKQLTSECNSDQTHSNHVLCTPMSQKSKSELVHWMVSAVKIFHQTTTVSSNEYKFDHLLHIITLMKDYSIWEDKDSEWIGECIRTCKSFSPSNVLQLCSLFSNNLQCFTPILIGLEPVLTHYTFCDKDSLSRFQVSFRLFSRLSHHHLQRVQKIFGVGDQFNHVQTIWTLLGQTFVRQATCYLTDMSISKELPIKFNKTELNIQHYHHIAEISNKTVRKKMLQKNAQMTEEKKKMVKYNVKLIIKYIRGLNEWITVMDNSCLKFIIQFLSSLHSTLDPTYYLNTLSIIPGILYELFQLINKLLTFELTRNGQDHYHTHTDNLQLLNDIKHCFELWLDKLRSVNTHMSFKASLLGAAACVNIIHYGAEHDIISRMNQEIKLLPYKSIRQSLKLQHDLKIQFILDTAGFNTIDELLAITTTAATTDSLPSYTMSLPQSQLTRV